MSVPSRISERPASARLAEIKEEYATSLMDLTVNSKPLINMLTMLAEDNILYAKIIIDCINEHLERVPAESKLAVLYLVDSILKNVGNAYTSLISKYAEKLFLTVLEKVGVQYRPALHKLRMTWNGIIPSSKLASLDEKLHAVDPEWPLSTSVNPRYISSVPNAVTEMGSREKEPITVVPQTKSAIPQPKATIDPEKELRKKQKELLELRQKKLELELERTKKALSESKELKNMEQQVPNDSATVKPQGHITYNRTSLGNKLSAVDNLINRIGKMKGENKSSTEVKAVTERVRGLAATFTKSLEEQPVNQPAVILTMIRQLKNKLNELSKLLDEVEQMAGKNQDKKGGKVATSSRLVIAPSSNSTRVVIPPNGTTSISNTSRHLTISSHAVPKITTSDVQNRMGNTGLDQATNNVKIAPVSTQLLNAVRRARDPRLNNRIEQQHNEKTKSLNDVVANHTERQEQPPTDNKNKLNVIGKKMLKDFGKALTEGDSKIFDYNEASKPSLIIHNSNLPSSKINNAQGLRMTTKDNKKKDKIKLGKKESIIIKDNVPEDYKKCDKIESLFLNKELNEKERRVVLAKVLSDEINKLSKTPVDECNSSIKTVADTKSISRPTKRSSLEEPSTEFQYPSKKLKTKNIDELFNEKKRSPKSEKGLSSEVKTSPIHIVRHPPIVHQETLKPEEEINIKSNENENKGVEKMEQTSRSDTPNGDNTKKTSLREESKDTEQKWVGESIVNSVLARAKEELSKGLITYEQYNHIITQVLEMNSDEDSNESTPSKIQNVPETVTDKLKAENSSELNEEIVEPYSPGNVVSMQYFEEPLERIEITNAIEEGIYEEEVVTEIDDTEMAEEPTSTNNEEEIPGFGSNDSEMKVETNVFENIVNSKKYDIKDVVYANNNDNDNVLKDETDDKLNDEVNDDIRDGNNDDVINEENKCDLDERVLKSDDFIEDKMTDHDSDGGNKDQDIRQEIVKVLQDNDLKFIKDGVVDNSLKTETSIDIDSRISLPGPFSDVVVQINPDEQLQAGIADVDYRQFFLKNLAPATNWPITVVEEKDEIIIKDDNNSNGSASPVVERKRRRKRSSDEGDNSDNNTMRSKRKNVNSRRRYRRRKSSSEEDRRSRSPYKRSQYSTAQVVPPAPTISVKKFANRVPSPTPLIPEVPQAQQSIVRCIEINEIKSINIDGIMREIRYYNYNAVVFIKWDDPRDISFYNGTRSVIFNDIYVHKCSLNSPPIDIVLEGRKISVKLGAPTRELYINNEWFECHFGGPPINVPIMDRSYTVLLDGPPPTVNIGKIKRYDLVAGKIFMVIDNTRHPLYLDAKLQRVDVDGCPIVVQFIDSLRKVVLNNVPFPATYDGEQKSFRFMGKVRYFSFTRLPSDVRPGQVNITDMMAEILPPPPSPPFVPDFEDASLKSSLPKDFKNQTEKMETPVPLPPGIAGKETASLTSDTTGVPVSIPPLISIPSDNHQYTTPILPPPIVPLDMLPELLTMSNENAIAINSDDENEQPEDDKTAVEENANNEGKPQFNLDMLFKRLVDSGIVANSNTLPLPSTDKTEDANENLNLTHIIPVDIYNLQTQYPDVPRQEYLITKMYSGVQCATCALRYSSEDTVRYRNHLDWHFRENRRARDPQNKVQSRELYDAMNDWIEHVEEGENWFDAHPEENQETIEPEKEMVSVAADKDDQSAKCELCHETFEHFYKDEAEEWHLKNAIRVGNKLYHPSCYEGHKEPEVDDDVLISEVITETINLDELTEDSKNDVDENSQDSGEGIIDITKIKEEKADTPSSKPIILSTEESEVTDDSDIEEVELIEEPIVQIIINDDHDHEPNLEVLNLEDITDVQCERNEDKKEETASLSGEKNNSNEEVAQGMKDKEEIVDITHSEISMDGNIELSDSLQMVSNPTKIKINIKRSNVSPTPIDEKNEQKTVDTENPQENHPSLSVTHFKPRLSDAQLTQYPPVHKGTEISGLCSIM